MASAIWTTIEFEPGSSCIQRVRKALKAAGIPFPGHTEILADRTRTADFGMMLIEGPLRVILVSIHVSLREAIGLVTPEAVSVRVAPELA